MAEHVTRIAAYELVGGAAAGLAVAASAGVLPVSVLVSTAPGMVTAVAIAANPPSPARLRVLGWTLVMLSVVTAAVVLMTARGRPLRRDVVSGSCDASRFQGTRRACL